MYLYVIYVFIYLYVIYVFIYLYVIYVYTYICNTSDFIRRFHFTL